MHIWNVVIWFQIMARERALVSVWAEAGWHYGLDYEKKVSPDLKLFILVG